MKYLKFIIACFLASSVISLIGVFISLSLGWIGTADTDFRNLPYGIAIAFNLYLAIGSLPMLFNLNTEVRTSPKWSALSFFLLPLLFVIFSLLLLWDEPWPGILFCVPYMGVLLFLFLRFRKRLQNHSVQE